MIEHNIQVKLDHFDGPLGLLLHLIQREEMNIKELEINSITNQYIDYLQKMQDLNFDVAGEYLYMAATLLYIKSKNVTEDEEQKIRISDDNIQITTKTQLIQKLEELQKFQRLGETLMTLPRRDEDIFVKPKVDRKSIQNSILTPMSADSLTESMVDLIRREKRKYTVIKRDKLSIKEKLVQLKSDLRVGTQTTMDKLIKSEKKDITEVVITFISLLELARLNKLDVFQNEVMGQIYVEVKENLDSFDVETADGFEPEDAGESVSTEDLVVADKSTTQQDTQPKVEA